MPARAIAAIDAKRYSSIGPGNDLPEPSACMVDLLHGGPDLDPQALDCAPQVPDLLRYIDLSTLTNS